MRTETHEAIQKTKEMIADLDKTSIDRAVDKILNPYKRGKFGAAYHVNDPLFHKASGLEIKVGTKVYWEYGTVKNHRLTPCEHYEVLGTIQWHDATTDKYRAGEILVYSAGKVRVYSAREVCVVKETTQRYYGECELFTEALAQL